MIYLKLYFIFFQIGLLAFGGGYAALPLIQKFVVEKYGFIDIKTMLDIVSISQMTPGPIAINAATFVGQNVKGLLGAIICTVAVVSPQVLIISIFMKLIGFRNKYISIMLKGVSVAITALILISTIAIFKSAIIENFSYITGLIFVFGLYFYYKGVSIIKLIVLSAIIGVVFRC